MIFNLLSNQLHSLSSLLVILQNEHYTQKIEHLGNASIGGHTRHILELLQCAIAGYHSGEVDYINRTRNIQLENDRLLAMNIINKILNEVRMPEKELSLFVEQMDEMNACTVNTTFFREIVYNTEHTIHHLAMIKVALIEMQLEVVESDFGVAYSTLQYKKLSKG